MAVSEQAMKQLSRPQQTVARVLTENWREAKEPCPDNSGDFCGITGHECLFSTCPKLKVGTELEVKNERNDKDR